MTRPRPLRVTYLVGQLDPGGSERQLQLTLAELDRTRFDCSVVVFSPDPEERLASAIRQLGVRIEILPRECRGIRKRIVYLRRLLRELRPDVVHSWTFHLNPFAGLVGLGCGVPGRIGSLRGSLRARRTDLSPLFRWLSVVSTRHLTVNSEAALEELTRTGLARSRISLIPNALPAELLNGAAEGEAADLSEHGIDTSHRVVGIVANLRRIKNHAMFVRALGIVCRRRADVRGLIVGQASAAEPEIPGEIDALIRAEGLEEKLFLAGLRGDVPTLLRRFDALCLTSWNEGTPNAVLEAMALGCPVAATAVGGLPGIVGNESTGLLVPTDDHAALARALETLLDDPALARRLADAARARVRATHHAPGVARQFENLYLDCSRGRRRGHASSHEAQKR